jgi:hypothetical protein
LRAGWLKARRGQYLPGVAGEDHPPGVGRQVLTSAFGFVQWSLGETWAGPTTAHGRLMVTVPGGLAGFRRELIRAHGRRRERAKARGMKMGRQSISAALQGFDGLNVARV